MASGEGFQGLCDLGDTFKGLVVTTPATQVPTAADALPTARVYSSAGYLMNATVTAFDSGNLTGAYQWSIVASGANGFVAGQTYKVVVNYLVSAVAFSITACFSVS